MVKTVLSRPSVVHKSITFMYYPVKAFLHAADERFAPGEAEVLSDMADGIAKRPLPYWCDLLIKVVDNHYMEHRKIRPDKPLAPCEFRDSFHPTEIHVWSDGSWGITVASTRYALSGLEVLAKFSSDGTSFTQKVN